MQPEPSDASVRCLGWENLERSLEELSGAISHTLARLGVPHQVAALVRSLPCSFVATPPQPYGTLPLEVEAQPAVGRQQPDAQAMAIDGPPDAQAMAVDGWMPQSPDLCVCIQVFAAEAENAGRHHVRVRRTQGGHWRFQAFYASFRREFSAQLGLADEKQLSFYSPMQPRRQLDVASMAPAAGFASRDVFASSGSAARAAWCELDGHEHQDAQPPQPLDGAGGNSARRVRTQSQWPTLALTHAAARGQRGLGSPARTSG